MARILTEATEITNANTETGSQPKVEKCNSLFALAFSSRQTPLLYLSIL